MHTDAAVAQGFTARLMSPRLATYCWKGDAMVRPDRGIGGRRAWLQGRRILEQFPKVIQAVECINSTKVIRQPDCPTPKHNRDRRYSA